MLNTKLPFTKQKIVEIMKSHPTPFHIYDEKAIRKNARRLKEAFKDIYGFKEYFAVKALPKGVKILSFDAHYDLKEVWEGSEYTHNTWLRRASEIVGPKKICVDGVRSGDEFEWEYSKDILANPGLKELREFVKGRDVYLSVDMDVFDPSIAPGVGTPEPGGMMYKDFVEKVKMVLFRLEIREIEHIMIMTYV